MLNPIFAGITSFLVSCAFLPFVIRFAKKKKLYQPLANVEFTKE